MTISYSTAAANARLGAAWTATGQAAGASVNGNASPGTCDIYTTGGSASGTLLVSFPLSAPPGSISSKTMTLTVGGGITATPVANGTAAVAEFHDGGGTGSATLVCSTTDLSTLGGHDVQLSTLSISTAVPCTLNSCTVTHP